MREITSQDLTSLIDRISPHTDRKKDGFPTSPVFPSERKDVCAIKRSVGSIFDGGFDAIYLVWKNDKGLNHEEIENTEGHGDYMFIDYVTDHDGDIDVRYDTGNHYASMSMPGIHYRKSKIKLGLD